VNPYLLLSVGCALAAIVVVVVLELHRGGRRRGPHRVGGPTAMSPSAALEMPPLTSLDVLPLHLAGKRSAWGHELRPGVLPALDVYVIEWDWRCRGCVLSAEAYVAAGVDPELPWTRAPGAEPIMVRLSLMVARSRRYWEQTQ